MSDEVLHTCPRCGRSGFTTAGLRHHRCRAVSDAADLPAVAPKLPPFPVAVAGTWDGARKWRDASVAMERGKLFCQVMLGFELVALRATIGLQQGGDHKTAEGRSKSQSGTLIWDEALERELGLSRTTAYRLMEMAEAARPRLKKTPELRDFDPTAQPVALLPAPQQEALESAVKKLTDGSTQARFMRDLGIAKGAETRSEPGDAEWPTWLKEHHPDLLVDGKAPARGKVPKEVRKAFEAYLKEKLGAEIGPKAMTKRVLRLAAEIQQACNDHVIGQADDAAFEALNEARLGLGDYMTGLAKRRAAVRGKGAR